MKKGKMKLFPFLDVFEYSRGERFIEKEQISGEIAYISSTKHNNGISAYVTPPEYMTLYKNKITLSNSGSVGYCFYHDYEFVASDHVTVIWLKDKSIELTEKIGLYLKPILESMRYKYNFGREISNKRLEKEEILLPVDDDSNIDWLYMETYVDNCSNLIEFKSIETKNNLDDELNLNISEWKDFTYDQVFEINRGESKYLKDMASGNIPYVSATAFNHGISSFVNEYNRDGNCIVLNYDGSVGEAFYHPEPFFASEKVVTITLKDAPLSKYIALFLITMIKQEKFRYSYGLKWSVEARMKNSIIRLPALKADDGTFKKTSDGNYIPDWNYIEEFVKSLPYADKL